MWIKRPIEKKDFSDGFLAVIDSKQRFYTLRYYQDIRGRNVVEMSTTTAFGSKVSETFLGIENLNKWLKIHSMKWRKSQW